MNRTAGGAADTSAEQARASGAAGRSGRAGQACRQTTDKHAVLASLASRFGCPAVEYDESLTSPQSLLRRVDVNTLKVALWMPLSLKDGCLEVIACDPHDPALLPAIKLVFDVGQVRFRVATQRDLIRLIENSADLNPDFPVAAGRTPLAKVRTYLANLRTTYANQRTLFARGRTGLALVRTGIACLGIAVAFLRLFGDSQLLALELPLLILGSAAIIKGMGWYLPARRERSRIKSYPPYPVPEDYSAIDVSDPGAAMRFHRTPVVDSAQALRRDWDALSPVERRRFLANDRTNLAEERTILAYLRTLMAKARTGLALARTGVAFAGIGIIFLRKFHPGPWSWFDWALIISGILMLLEGFYCYAPGRDAANQGLDSVQGARGKKGLWDSIFPSRCLLAASGVDQPVEASSAQARPGVWATTGLALQRTTLADQRNAMSRLRTVMARSRTGMAFIRTGFSIMAVGAGLLVYFGSADLLWAAFDLSLVVIGLYLIADGLHWYLPAERIKRNSPFLDQAFAIPDADYSQPVSAWRKVRFADDD